jgi:hypothetical protein
MVLSGIPSEARIDPFMIDKSVQLKDLVFGLHSIDLIQIQSELYVHLTSWLSGLVIA